jgi:hypothetical protein
MSRKHFWTEPPSSNTSQWHRKWEKTNPDLVAKPYLRPPEERLPPRRTSFLRIPRNDATRRS